MHGGQAFLLVFAVLFLLNVPTFLFGFLAAKCSLYVFPGLKRFFIVRWVFPLAVAMLLLGFGVIVAVIYLIRRIRGPKPGHINRVTGYQRHRSDDPNWFWGGLGAIALEIVRGAILQEGASPIVILYGHPEQP